MDELRSHQVESRVETVVCALGDTTCISSAVRNGFRPSVGVLGKVESGEVPKGWVSLKLGNGFPNEPQAKPG